MLRVLYVMQEEIYHSGKGCSVIGLLDIYGFEVLQHNRYELLSFFPSHLDLPLIFSQPKRLYVTVNPSTQLQHFTEPRLWPKLLYAPPKQF